jgi:hypothetical protein
MHLRSRRPLPADERFLDHVLSIRDAPEHPVSNGEQQRPVLLENIVPVRRGLSHRLTFLYQILTLLYRRRTGEAKCDNFKEFSKF